GVARLDRKGGIELVDNRGHRVAVERKAAARRGGTEDHLSLLLSHHPIPLRCDCVAHVSRGETRRAAGATPPAPAPWRPARGGAPPATAAAPRTKRTKPSHNHGSGQTPGWSSAWGGRHGTAARRSSP